MDLIGDRWTMLIIRDLFLGRENFKDFCESPEKIATNTLTARLSRLLEAGVITRVPSSKYPGREAYRLTEKGQALRPVLRAVTKFGLEHIEGTSARMTPRDADGG